MRDPGAPLPVTRDAFDALVAPHRRELQAHACGVFARPGEFRLLQIPVSGGVGVAVYHSAPPDTVLRAHLVQALEVDEDGIATARTYLNASLFPRFGLPETLPAA